MLVHLSKCVWLQDMVDVGVSMWAHVPIVGVVDGQRALKPGQTSA